MLLKQHVEQGLAQPVLPQDVAILDSPRLLSLNAIRGAVTAKKACALVGLKAPVLRVRLKDELLES